MNLTCGHRCGYHPNGSRMDLGQPPSWRPRSREALFRGAQNVGRHNSVSTQGFACYRAEGEGGLGVANGDLWADPSPLVTAADAIRPRAVVNLTSHVRKDGPLDWTVPTGDWGNVRLGYIGFTELRTIRGKLGLPIEGDLHFNPNKPISAYGDEERAGGHIII